MEQNNPDRSATKAEHPVKRAYSTPRLSDFGSVETLSLSGTQVTGESPAKANRSKKP